MGRHMDGIRSLDEVNTLLKYLYQSEDHSVEFESRTGVRFELRMRDDFTLVRKMLTGIDRRDFTCDDINHKLLMCIVDQLKEQPASEFPDKFENRWEEVRGATLTNLALNGVKYLIALGQKGLDDFQS